MTYSNNLISFGDVQIGKNVTIFPNVVLGRPPMAPKGRTEIDYSKLASLPVYIGDGTIIGANSVIYNNVSIGKDCLIGDGVYIREGVSIGDGSIIGISCKVGARTIIGCNTRVMDLTNVSSDAVLGNNVFIGPGVMMGNDNSMGRDDAGDGFAFTGPKIQDWATLGMNVSVLPGVTIGADSIIAASAVVSKDIPAGVLAMGVPAKVVRNITVEETRCK